MAPAVASASRAVVSRPESWAACTLVTIADINGVVVATDLTESFITFIGPQQHDSQYRSIDIPEIGVIRNKTSSVVKASCAFVPIRRHLRVNWCDLFDHLHRQRKDRIFNIGEVLVERRRRRSHFASDIHHLQVKRALLTQERGGGFEDAAPCL